MATLNESGTVLVEYALVLALLSFAFLGGMKVVGLATSAASTNVTGELLHYAERDGN
jgi:Flp pilus assembly pilin Flp